MWAAYRNEGEPWTAFPSTSAGALRDVTFTATGRLAIATVTNLGGPFSAFDLRFDIRYLTSEQAEAAYTCVGLPRPSGKRLNGSVAGVSPENGVLISTGRGLATASALSPTFQIRAAESGPIDIVAVEHPPVPEVVVSTRVAKVIIRRGEDHAEGATMPVLDFSAAEAFAPQSNTLTIGGLSPGAPWAVHTNILTQRGAVVTLKYDGGQTSTFLTTYSVPASRLGDGDVNYGFAVTSDRTMSFFYRNPADRTLAFGPAPSTPSVTQAIPLEQIVRVDVPSQPEYGASISVALFIPQQATLHNTVSITATREYFGGTPATWSLVVPDLTGVSGFSPGWSPSPGPRGLELTVSSAPYPFAFTSGRDGDVFRTATAFRGITIGQ
jgi:hypothetical protein